jgi:hypothetical protein
LASREHRRLADDRAAHRDALALAAGQLRGLAAQMLAQPQHARRVLDLGADLLLGAMSQLQRETDVVGHAHVRVQRVVLEHHRRVPIAGRELVDDFPADADLALGHVLEPRDHSQRRRLAAPGRSHQHHELALVHLQADVGHRLGPVGVDLGDVLQLDGCHQLLLNGPLAVA